MSDYPDADEEFELMYGDELEALQDHETENICPEPEKISRRSLDFSSPAIRKTFGQLTNNAQDISNEKNIPQNNHLTDDIDTEELLDSFEVVDTAQPGTSKDYHVTDLSGVEDLPNSTQGSLKRNVEDLFGDIDDIVDLDDFDFSHKSKKRKENGDEDVELVLIEKILQERRRKQQINSLRGGHGTDFTVQNNCSNRDNISYTLPRWPYLTLKRSNGDTVYVRFHDEEYMEREIEEVTQTVGGFKDILGSGFRDIWEEARSYLQTKETPPVVVAEPDVQMVLEEGVAAENGRLWVEQYKPQRYMELLSDESSNRTLLHWLKMWDKIVFNREIKMKRPEVSSRFNKRSGKFEFGAKRWGRAAAGANVPDLSMELDEHGRPHHKITLLCGPPGVGKTTLAHMIAKQAGYNVVEINASDDRSVEAFKSALENATQMKSVLDEQKRPNCLVFDEIDGAPLPAIEYLLKFVSGAPMAKAKKGQKVKPHILRRPVICICNDMYTPSLRPMRQVAFVVQFPPTLVSRLSQRLAEVAAAEGLRADLAALTALAEKTSRDVRACLGVLHFFKAKGKSIKLVDILKANVGQKDMSKGLFQVWQEIFQIQLPKHQRMEEPTPLEMMNSAGIGQRDESIKLGCDSSLKGRAKKVLNTVYSAGDYERISQGVYENYLTMKMKDSMLSGVCQALDWFMMSDIFTSYINSSQNYTLMGYLPYSFVSWHFLFAGLSWPKIKFPSQGFEVYKKQTQLSGIVSAVDKSMCPRVKIFNSKSNLILDSMPMLPHIINPALRPVNIQLYSEREKKDLATVVGVMMDYGVQYIQERSQDGNYSYVLDPDICKVGILDEKTSSVRHHTYAMKQLIAREVDLEKIRRVEQRHPAPEPAKKRALPKLAPSTSTTSKEVATENQAMVPNHLQRLVAKKVTNNKPLVMKDFFGRIVTCSPATAAKKAGKIDDIVKSSIWYHYKEGFNNAVRRDVKMSDLL